MYQPLQKLTLEPLNEDNACEFFDRTHNKIYKQEVSSGLISSSSVNGLIMTSLNVPTDLYVPSIIKH
jgi:hypothetical protein